MGPVSYTHLIETLLTAGEDAEIILVDDGSKDDTGKIAEIGRAHV